MKGIDCTEEEIREGLNKRILRNQRTNSSFVIEELGLDHGANRIDLAVLNSSIHGFEIKSSRDNLNRLPNQLLSYTAALDKLTMVIAPNHLESVLDIIPEWCGVQLVEKGIRGGISFQTIRRPLRNPEIDIYRMAHLLWKNEAMNLLVENDIPEVPKSATRTQLYKSIAENIPLPKLREYIKECFISRDSWRVALR